jgi:SAM-dependent methyltransferase
MDVKHETNDAQAALWNGPAGHAWVESQELLDHILAPIEDWLVQAVVPGSGGRVLDVGCGTGTTTLAVARHFGAKSACLGVDISDPMIRAARARAERSGTRADFVVADAQVHPFEPAGFDRILSRFGVMFFDDPVRAFANLRRAASDDAELCLVVWRGAAENPFLTAAERAAAPLLPSLPSPPPDAPGRFAFAEPARVHGILEESGWAAIDIRPMDFRCTLPENELMGYLTRVGPLGRALEEVDEGTRTQVMEAIRPAFDSYVQGAEVQFDAACWSVGARAAAR